MADRDFEAPETQAKTDYFMVWLVIVALAVVALCYLLIHAKVISENDRVGVSAVVAAIITLLAIFFQIVDAQRSSREQRSVFEKQNALMVLQNAILENQKQMLDTQIKMFKEQNAILEQHRTELEGIHGRLVFGKFTR